MIEIVSIAHAADGGAAGGDAGLILSLIHI